jgi:saccharopine dehydrogenase-like NADP-dependent oxidoreductase
MARWMVSKGARHIVLVSRSGSASDKVKELIDDLAVFGAEIVVRSCDVVNKNSVDALIKDMASMPIIRGVVHGAMVLHVSFSRLFFQRREN